MIVYKQSPVPSSRAWLLSTLARILEYSLTTSFHLDIARSPALAFLSCGCFSQRRMQRASTTRLLEGEEAGDPADRKHLKSIDHFKVSVVHSRLPFHVINASVADSLPPSKSSLCWRVRSHLEHDWSLVILLQGIVQLYDLSCFRSRYTQPSEIHQCSCQLIYLPPARNSL